jgi:hypothetical protein
MGSEGNGVLEEGKWDRCQFELNIIVRFVVNPAKTMYLGMY